MGFFAERGMLGFSPVGSVLASARHLFMRTHFPIIAAFAISLSPFFAQASERPNILLILVDDLGYADVGFNGSKDIKTPQLDALAKKGTTFSSAYVVHPFCGPSRMGLFSGRYPHNFGAPFNLPDVKSNEYLDKGISTSETLVSKVLQDSGYFTGLMGKWHMGEKPEFHPNKRGFDEFYGFLGGGKNYFGPYQKQTWNRWSYTIHPEYNGADDATLTKEDYITDVLSHQGVEFLNKAKGKDEPFFLMMAYNAPHTPLQAKASDMAEFPKLKGKRKIYAGMVYAVDRGVGELVKTLKMNGQFEKTLIVFLSDNGGRSDQGANNGPLRGVKGDVTEGGFRVPMFFHWPKVIPEGKTYLYPVTALDFYPTFSHLAKATTPDGKVLDGKNIWEAILAGRNAREGDPIYAIRHRIGNSPKGQSDVGIRKDGWKAVKLGAQNWRLYAIDQDPGEKTDVSEKNAAILREMISAAKAWSGGHTIPNWYDSVMDGQAWKTKGMPHYDALFQLP